MTLRSWRFKSSPGHHFKRCFQCRPNTSRDSRPPISDWRRSSAREVVLRNRWPHPLLGTISNFFQYCPKASRDSRSPVAGCPTGFSLNKNRSLRLTYKADMETAIDRSRRSYHHHETSPNWRRFAAPLRPDRTAGGAGRQVRALPAQPAGGEASTLSELIHAMNLQVMGNVDSDSVLDFRSINCSTNY